MATIARVQRSSGVRFKAIVKRNGVILATKTFHSEEQARAWAVEVEQDKARLEAYADHGSMSFQEVVKVFLAQYEGRDKDFTRRLHLWADWLGTTKLDDVTPALIRTMLDKYGKTHNRYGEPLSGATLNRMKAAVSSLFSYAVSENFTTTNPARSIRARKEAHHVIRWLSEDERTRLLAACKESKWPKLYLLVLMALATGARRGDLIGLRWSDIDLENRLAHVARTKNGSSRVLSLSLPVVQELKRFEKEAASNGLVFCLETDSSKPKSFDPLWYEALRQAKVERFRFHDLRHTTASYLAQNSVPLHTIAEVLGHSSLQTTMRYAHLNHAARQRVQDQVLGGIA